MILIIISTHKYRLIYKFSWREAAYHKDFNARLPSILFKILINCEIYLILFDISSMIYTAINK